MTLPTEYMVLPKRRQRSKQWTANSIATLFALVLSVITLFLTLLGYGHELAFLEKLGLRPEDLQYAPLDFLMRSWRPLLAWINSHNKVFTWEHSQHLLKMMWQDAWLPLSIFAILFMAVDWIRQHPKFTAKMSRKTLSGSNWIALLWQKFLQKLRARKWRYAGWLGFPIFFTYATGVLLIFYVVSTLVLVGIAIVPALGFASGTERAKEEVINPKTCLGTKLVKGHEKDPQARCLRVMRDDKELARGYLIEYGTDRVFLYQPSMQHWLSVPLRNAIVEEIDSLHTPQLENLLLLK